MEKRKKSRLFMLDAEDLGGSAVLKRAPNANGKMRRNLLVWCT